MRGRDGEGDKGKEQKTGKEQVSDTGKDLVLQDAEFVGTWHYPVVRKLSANRLRNQHASALAASTTDLSWTGEKMYTFTYRS